MTALAVAHAAMLTGAIPTVAERHHVVTMLAAHLGRAGVGREGDKADALLADEADSLLRRRLPRHQCFTTSRYGSGFGALLMKVTVSPVSVSMKLPSFCAFSRALSADRLSLRGARVSTSACVSA